jgi:CheY-like chemotaxis protein
VTAPAERASALHRVLASGPPSALVVDAVPGDRAFVEAALRGAGYRVDAVGGAAEAFARCHERSYDVVVVDVLLPGGAGLELLRSLRAGPETRATPLVVLSQVTDGEIVEGFSVSEVLRKPASAEQLLGAVRRARARARVPAKVLVVDDDPAALRWMEATLADFGCAAVCHSDGASGLAAVEDERPAAVVLDLQMPRMDGFEFLRQLRSSRAGARLPVIVWTVRDLSTQERAELAATAQAIVPKSSGRDALLRELLLQAPVALGGGDGR